jgi:predicted amidohydrolase
VTDAITVSVATLAIRRYPDLAAFEAHVDGLAARAVEAGSGLLLLPELAGLGLLWSDAGAGTTDVPGVGDLYRRVLTPMLGGYRAALSRVAAGRGLTIAGASFWHEEAGHGTNSAFVFRPDGAVLRQDKLHPTRPERAIATEGGDHLAAFDVGGVRMGLLVCYDIQFPELTRTLVDDGVEVLLVPSLTDERGTWRVRHAAHARAVENQLYVCVSPLVGDLGIPTGRPVHGCGGAFVACPIDNRFGIDDGTFARAGEGVEGLLTVTLDLSLLRLSRAKGEIRQLADRRPELYDALRRGRVTPNEGNAP